MQQEMERRCKLLLMENEQLKINLRQLYDKAQESYKQEMDSPNPPLRKKKNLL